MGLSKEVEGLLIMPRERDDHAGGSPFGPNTASADRPIWVAALERSCAPPPLRAPQVPQLLGRALFRSDMFRSRSVKRAMNGPVQLG